MTNPGPYYLRWNAGRPKPEEEAFPDLDAALDAVEARWETLQHQVPQIYDRRRVLAITTAELLAMAEDEAEGQG